MDNKKNILGPEDVEKHAIEIAKNHVLGENKKFPKRLISQVNNSYRRILEVYKSLNRETRGGAPSSTAAEWLLDNFFIVEEQVKDIKSNIFDKHFFRLPVLKNGHFKGYPRVYSLARELVSHTDGSIDESNLLSFLKSYQSRQSLFMGELWAMAIMLRIALIEDIRTICDELHTYGLQREEALEIANLIVSATEKDDGELEPIIDAKVIGRSEINATFMEILVQSLRKNGRKTAVVIGNINQKLQQKDISLEELVKVEHRQQAGRQVSMGNAITSLRTIAAIDWNEIFESLSQVEEILRRDPAACYSLMDFESRDHYRHVIEKVAHYYNVSEIEVAEEALKCADETLTEQDNSLRHVGYYLIREGRKTLEQRIGTRPRGIKGALGFFKGYPHIMYFGSIALITLAIMAFFLSYAATQGLVSIEVLLLIGFILLIPISDISINIVNFTVSRLYSPSLLPKLELSGGIAEEKSTMVIIPTLLPNARRVEELIEKLEIYYLANKETNLYFALIGDFKDSQVRELEDDAAIANAAIKGVKELNQRYAKNKDVFYYFNRQRQYSETQKHWMGWERKRGAILEFNDLLRGSKVTSFNILSCQLEQIPEVKYVITLDADTNLVMGSARKLIGTMAHPLNKPVTNKDGVVVKGHGILQPRIGVSLVSANKTYFSQIFAGQGGIDPYTTAVSDTYQDLFGEGIFTGKGIYELDTFQNLLKGTIPENSVLSHDLLEGSYVRAGLVTDIELIDGYPARYNSFSMRLHRWVRGDWQLIPWLLKRVKDTQGQWQKNPLSALSKWKIIDNLRRSLLNPALAILIGLGFSVLPGSTLVWLGLAMVTIAFPTITYLAGGVLAKTYHLMEGTKVQTVITGVKAGIYQTVLQFLFIPYQAYLMLDAIAKTLVRVFFTRKNLLEWIPAADVEVLLKNDLRAFFKNMFISPVFGLLVLAFVVLRPGTSLEIAVAGLIFLLWSWAPYVAYRVSQESKHQVQHLDRREQLELRRLARKTWAYFEDLITAKDNYLPPDNYQVMPAKGIAHRTSPTNVGLLMISTLAARDLGYLNTAQMIKRLDATVSTVEQMEKWEGHLYNWYDTTNLKVLRPRFVSTVDSGNFVGYLMVIQEGLKEYLNNLVDNSIFAQGLLDTFRILNDELKVDLEKVEGVINTRVLEEYLAADNNSKQSWVQVLNSIEAQLKTDEIKGKIRNSPWGKKALSMVDAYQKASATNIDDDVFRQGENLLKRIGTLIENTKFTPLFDPKRQLFSIGYNVEEGVLIKSYYDLLASEARIVSYIAIARGEVDKKHWFRLGRKLAKVDGHKGLVSWTGTMFEYFMPLLVMRNFDNSLLAETYSFVVQAQKRYGKLRKIPWGVSESGYYAFDVASNYQYKAFGVPELGYKRGLGNETVVAPYATVLALATDLKGAMENLFRLKEEGMEGDYGLYEAIDYTPVRADLRGQKAIVKSFMAHHQGMSILALNNCFNNNIMQRRFHTNPLIKSAEVLLEERMPYNIGIVKEHQEEFEPLKRKFQDGPEVVRKFGLPDSQLPNVHLLSNGNYSLMITNGGSGYSRLDDMAVARWKETLGGTGLGFFVYVQNINSNNVWSATFEPYNVEPEQYKAVFSPDKVEFLRKDGNIETHTEIVVSPEDNAEIRTITFTNNSQHARVLEVTSYLETVLAHPDADLAHPAFSNLFVTTEFVAKYNCLLAARRPRSSDQKPVYALHTISVEGEIIGDLQYETDRAKFIGRNRDLDFPLAMDVDQPLSNSVGAVLDPIMSLRRRVKIQPHHSVKIAYTLAVTDSRKEALMLADKYREFRAVERAFQLAWNRSRIEHEYLAIKASETEVYLNVIPPILFASSIRRKYEKMIFGNKKGQPGLWPFGISGDLPIILIHLSNIKQIDLGYQLLKAHELWRMRGLKVDLVFLVEDASGYIQPLQDKLREAFFASHARDLMNQKGGVYLLNAHDMGRDEINLLYATARFVLKGDAGSIEEQLTGDRVDTNDLKVDNITTVRKIGDRRKVYRQEKETSPLLNIDSTQLTFFNGFGGFSQDGQEYIIHLKEGQHTPAPWINVIANPEFGFNITEVGAGYTWAENSRENKLTPWNNDPVKDKLGEVYYLRDEQRGDYWSITPMPVREKEVYLVRHGKGYTSFEHISHDIEQELTEFVALDAPVKISLIKLKNRAEASKEISLTYYMRPVMGVNEKISLPFIITESYGEKGVLLIRNSYNSDFPGRVAFINTSEANRSLTGDNNEFIGINGSLEYPAALKRERLSGTVGAGLIPCGAMQIKVSLKPGEVKEVVFLLGQGRDVEEAVSVAEKYSQAEVAKAELAKVKAYWSEKLGIIKVSTPDKAMNILLNGWLQYQVIACRVWSRAAFYQSGGAYGFRDQLQDVMATAYTWPELTRKQILLHCAHQFIEGDVQHWWHPGANKGIRTRYSDDYLWLPYVTADYIQATNDWSVLKEVVGFLEDEPLPVDEDEKYNIPRLSEKKDTVYIHCIKAIENGLKFGEHGLPLMGSGDWNDGMNKVGNQGKGESVWLAWFLYTVLQKFIPICKSYDDQERVEKYTSMATKIAEAIERNAWDGSWYRRAYFDDGTPLGSVENSECKIDAIAQAWSVISGVGKAHRVEEAMQAVDNYLVDREAGIIKLLSPPFGEGDLEPGYIKGYVAGVRENGGQYTHAAIWVILAFAKLGYGDKVGELFGLINPINHTRTMMEVMRYKVEPYVMAADVYAVHPNTGRGGWSWYTGAAGWMYRVGVEHILGIKKFGDSLRIDPCIPKEWQDFEVHYRLAKTLYQINVRNLDRVNKGIKKITVDGQEVLGNMLSLIDDGGHHTVEVIMGKIKVGQLVGGNSRQVDGRKGKVILKTVPKSAAKKK